MSKYRIVIRAFTLRRDIASAELLRRLLEREGCQVILASSRDFVRSLRYGKPDAVIVNSVGQIRRSRELAPKAAIIMWPGEGANAPKHSDPTNFADRTGDYEMLSRYLTWGQGTEALFDKYMPHADPAKRVLCGNPRLDLVKFHPELLDTPSDGKTVGFIGRYHSINRYDRVPTIFSMQTPDKRARVMWQVDNFIAMIALVHRLIEETDLQISIRPHPLEAPEGYEFLFEDKFAGRIEIDDSLDLAAWIARQRVIVSPSSTSFYESYVLRVPLIHLDPLTGNSELVRDMTPHAALSQEVSYNPHSYDEAMAMITAGLPPPTPNALIDSHLHDFHDWFSPQSAIRRAADAVMDVLRARPPIAGPRHSVAAIDLWDRVSFRRAVWRDPLHTNFSYHRHYHSIPTYFDRILDNILATRTIHDKTTAGIHHATGQAVTT